MKKRIIFLVFCVVLLLIFTSLSYAKPDPRYERIQEHPDQELLSPPHGDQVQDVLLIIIPNWNNFSVLICTKNDAIRESPARQSLTTQESNAKTNNIKRAR